MTFSTQITDCSLLILGLLTIPAKSHPAAKWAQASLMLVWYLIFALSVGPLAYCIVGEVSSTRLRGYTVGLARNAYNIVSDTSSLARATLTPSSVSQPACF